MLLISNKNHTTTLHSGNHTVVWAVYSHQQYLDAKIVIILETKKKSARYFQKNNSLQKLGSEIYSTPPVRSSKSSRYPS